LGFVEFHEENANEKVKEEEASNENENHEKEKSLCIILSRKWSFVFCVRLHSLKHDVRPSL